MPLAYPGNSISKEARAKAGGGFESAIEAVQQALSFVAETGFSITGQVADLAEVTISGQDFGTKAPQRHFDRGDRHWNKGAEVVNPYGSLADGSSLPNTAVEPASPFPDTGSGEDMYNWKLRSEAARRGRTLGYQLESLPDGQMEGTSNAGFAGWPATQKDSEIVYLREWRYMLYPPTDKSKDGDLQLTSSLSAGATQLPLTVAPSERFNRASALREIYIQMDDGSLFYTVQKDKLGTETLVNITTPLPSPASLGNPVYIRSDYAHKELRIRDADFLEPDNSSKRNQYAFAGYQGSTSNYDWLLEEGRTDSRWIEGVWELWEHYTVAPKEQVSVPEGVVMFTRRNGKVVLDVKNQTSLLGGWKSDIESDGWPSSGCAVTNYGFEQDRIQRIPNNKFRLSDIYVDNSRRRVEIGIGNDNLYLCSNREPCPIKTWNSSITVNLNALPFTESELAQARVFVVDEDDTATLVGRIQ